MRQKSKMFALLILGAWSLVVPGQTTWAQPPASPNFVPTDSMQDPLDSPDQRPSDAGQPGPVVDANGNLCPPSQACAPCAVPTRLYFSADAMFLNLSRARSRDLVLDQNTLSPVLSTNNLDFDKRAIGPRLNLVYAMTDDLRFQASYFGFLDWNTFAIAPGSNNLSLPGDIGLVTDDFNGADHMQVTYGTKLQTVEFNALRRMGNRNLSLLAGFRYLSIMEHLDINSTDSDGSVSDYRTSTNNNLFGGQIGGSWQRRWGILRLGVVGKAGVYGNSASQRNFLGDFGNTFVYRDSKTIGSTAAFVTELGVNETIDITRNFFVRVGYNLIWITNVARAPDQLDFTNTPTSGLTLNHSGNIFLYGVNVGAGCRF